MKKNKLKYIVIIVVGLLLSVNYQAAELSPETQTLVIDPNLRICIATTQGVTNRQLTVDDLSAITVLDCEGYNIGSIYGLQYATNLESLNLKNNDITDISPLRHLNKIGSLDLRGNHISDLSPLAGYSPRTYITATGQTIYYQDLVATTDRRVTYQIIDLQGNSHMLTSNPIKPGLNEVAINWNFSTNHPHSCYSGTVYQTVYYEPQSLITGDSTHQIDEGDSFSDEQLIEMYNVQSSLNDQITVDSSQVNYELPGKYPLTFSNEAGDSLSAELVVNDVLPQITSSVDQIYVPVNSTIDYISAFGVTAQELEANDLDSQIEVSATAINLEQAGNYPVEFSVSDDDGNTVTIERNVNVFKDSFTIDSNDGNVKVYIQLNDEQGNGIPGYEYTIYDEDGNVVDVIITDENGYGESKPLKNGNYSVVMTNDPNKPTKPSKPSDNQDDTETGSSNQTDNQNENTTELKSNVSESIDQSEVTDNLDLDQGDQSGLGEDDSGVQTGVDEGSNFESGSEMLSVEAATDSSEVHDTTNSEQDLKFEVVVDDGSSPAGISFDLISSEGKKVRTIVSDNEGTLEVGSLAKGEYQLVLSPESDHYILENEIKITSTGQNFGSGIEHQINLDVVHSIPAKLLSVVVIAGLGLALIVKKGI